MAERITRPPGVPMSVVEAFSESTKAGRRDYLIRVPPHINATAHRILNLSRALRPSEHDAVELAGFIVEVDNLYTSPTAVDLANRLAWACEALRELGAGEAADFINATTPEESWCDKFRAAIERAKKGR